MRKIRALFVRNFFVRKIFVQKFFVCVLLVFSCMSIRAMDFGLMLDQTPGFSGQGKEINFDYTGILIPRFSFLMGEEGRLYISLGFNFQNNPWSAIPELLRTEFSWGFGNSEIKLGRMHYGDPMGFIAQGLFDGAQFSAGTKAGNFSAGAWYTGLLYKKRTEITMTGDELNSFYSDLDYSHFYNTYFAPKRVIAALGWEHPGLKDFLRARFDILGQFDLEGTELHSQYAALKVSMPIGNFFFDLGGCFELIENKSDIGIGLAGELGIAWMLPTPIDDRLLLLGRFSSGELSGSSINAFLPVTTSYQGEVLKVKLSALSKIGLDYLVKFHKTVSADISSFYFIQSDKGTVTWLGSDGYFLGNEFFGRLIWSPVSDVLINLGGGVFLPRLGNAAPDADLLWRVELNLVLSLY